MKYYAYILKCIDDSYYTGSTFNLDERVKKHNQGTASEWTKMRRPVQLVYSEEYARLIDATQRERQIKNWTREKKDKLIKGLWSKPNK
ncbi:GIY-YIG nuclease family protein [Candidatus Uhrbacteria bacterium]|jgi:predicted GIY-YIG superfamily endonuclease|nr:GIY-YIG nuclease family protein [Candidatus Uhrbacteria bacterium]MBT7717485.1 GIY-YIG nuclease family protein [Candidatus Uhrbacteria bacterium]